MTPAQVDQDAVPATTAAALWIAAVKDAAAAAAVSAVLFVPILGLVLKHNEVDPEIWRPAIAVGVVFLGRLAIARVRLSGAVKARGSWGRFTAPLMARTAPVAAWLISRPGRTSLILIAVLGVFPFSPIASNYLIHILSQTFIYIMLAMGLNIVVGLAGLLDLGFVAFYAVGAYGFAMLAHYWGVSFWAAIPLTALIAASAGFLLGFPVLRMHGDYLAIVTLGFGEIIRLLLTNLKPLTGGPDGISAPRPTLFGLVFFENPPPGTRSFYEFFGIPFDPVYRNIFLYLVILLFTAAAVAVFMRLRHMPIGRAWEALKENDVAARALGIDPTTTKLWAFMLGASFAGIGGVFFAGLEGFITPASFTFIESATILSIVVLGGMGSVVGVILAAIGITLLPELFREFGTYRMLVFGLAMVFIMVSRPGGLLAVSRRSIQRHPEAGGAHAGT